MMILFQNQELGIRMLEPSDAVLLEKWLSDPVVLEYYEGRDRPHDQALVQQHFYDEADAITRCIILYESMEIGYIQFYEIDEEEKEEYGYGDSSAKLFGMDQFIGESAYWNRGIGSRLMKDTVQYLIRYQGAAHIVMDPQAWNARAIKVYEKTGFVKKKLLPKHEFHEGEYRDCWLMAYNVTSKKEGISAVT